MCRPFRLPARRHFRNVLPSGPAANQTELKLVKQHTKEIKDRLVISKNRMDSLDAVLQNIKRIRTLDKYEEYHTIHFGYGTLLFGLIILIIGVGLYFYIKIKCTAQMGITQWVLRNIPSVTDKQTYDVSQPQGETNRVIYVN